MLLLFGFVFGGRMSHVVDSPPLFVQIGFVSAASDGAVADQSS